jgi:hypothetical protein
LQFLTDFRDNLFCPFDGAGPIGYPEVITNVSEKPVCPFDKTDVIPNFVPTFRDMLVLLMGPIGYPAFFTDVLGQLVCPFDGTDRLSRIYYRRFGKACLFLARPICYPERLTDVSGQLVGPFDETDRLSRNVGKKLQLPVLAAQTQKSAVFIYFAPEA